MVVVQGSIALAPNILLEGKSDTIIAGFYTAVPLLYIVILQHRQYLSTKTINIRRTNSNIEVFIYQYNSC